MASTSLMQLPALGSTAELSPFERATVTTLANKIAAARPGYITNDAYYEGEHHARALGIAIPPKLRGLRAIVDWPRLACDSVAERADLVGFRYGAEPDADQDLWEIWQDNNLVEEQRLAYSDSVVYGRSYATVGAPDVFNDNPIITIDNPMTMTATMDYRRRYVESALRILDDGFVLYLPNVTITARRTLNIWRIERDEHNLGFCPVVVFPNAVRTKHREGVSEIGNSLKSLTDAASRTLVQLQVAGEFYSAPQRYILGANEDDFINADGTKRTGWDTYLGRVLALTRDEDGNIPTVSQFTAYSPQVYTEVVQLYSKMVSSVTALPPHYFGFSTDNPASADAIEAGEFRLLKHVGQALTTWGGSWTQLMRIALIWRDGRLPNGANRMEPIWANPATPKLASTVDAVTKLIQTNHVPAGSSVLDEMIGWSPIQQLRIDSDRNRNTAGIEEMVAALATPEDAAAGRAAGETAAVTGV